MKPRMTNARFWRYATVPTAALLLLSCRQGGEGDRAGAAPVDNADTVAVTNAAAAAPANASDAGNDANAAAPAVAAKPAVTIADKTALLDFSYGWPSEAAAIPALDTWLRGNAAAVRERALAPARAEAASAKSSDYPYRQHSYATQFATVADTPALLILQSEGYVYTGGAHGMPIVTDIIWDKAAGKRLATKALVDLQAFAKAATPAYCRALQSQRAEKRGAPVDEKEDMGGIKEFVTCVPLLEQDVLPISKGGTALDTMRIYIAPYNAGPYAEGSYTIDLPMDAALLATVRPAWKGAFAAR